MERLTGKYENQNIAICKYEECDKHELECMICNECELYTEMVGRLSEYEDLEEQGLLIKLPYKIGDKYYLVGDICKNQENTCNYECEFCQYCAIGIVEDAYKTQLHIAEHYLHDAIGKTVFLTKEEAEKALKESE